METQEFAIPSPKRQRTESPKPNREATPTTHQSLPPKSAGFQDAEVTPRKDGPEIIATIPGLGLPVGEPGPQNTEAQASLPESNAFLDALMLHVESISQPEAQDAASDRGMQVVHPPAETQEKLEQSKGRAAIESEVPDVEPALDAVDHTPSISKQEPVEDNHPNPGLVHTDAPKSAVGPGPMSEQAGMMDSVTADQDQPMIEEPQPTEGGVAPEGVEWEVDSSPYVSSDSDDSSDTTSDDSDDDDADGDYAMLDPEEQARILMAGDGGSDDEGDKKGKTEGGHLRTANERIEEVIPKPDIAVTEEMSIEELGVVEGVVEKTVLVRAKVSGEYQVLESNSLLCLENRSVVGVVAEPLGRVEQPMYTIRFTNDDAIKEAGLSERGTKVFYVPQHSTFVFTQPLKAVRGSDASNFHDEEVGDDEMEFSDDEQEAEHKRALKMKRQGRRDEQGGGRGRGRGGRGNYQRGGRQEFRTSSGEGGSVYGGGPSEISYDDVAEGADEGYTPLARPANLNEMMAGVQREPMEGSHFAGGYSDRGDPSMGRSRGRGRGRGGRDRRNGRGGRGGGGGQPSWTTHQNLPSTQSSAYAQHPQQSMPPPPQYSQQWQQQPYQPRLSPQTQQTPFSPSPISPLSGNPFNFNFQQQSQQWPAAQPYSQQQPYGTQQFGQQQGQISANGWNQAAAAQVAAQLEQLRRNQGGQ